MPESKQLGRLLTEGMQVLVENRVSDMIDAITNEVVAEKIKDLKSELEMEVKAVVRNNSNVGQDMLDVMVTVTTKKGGK